MEGTSSSGVRGDNDDINLLTFIQVAHFGLPPAAVISLALLKRSGTGVRTKDESQMIQNLCVLVAEIRAGAVISPSQPFYELFTRAARTIQSILDSSLTLATQPPLNMTNQQGNPIPDLLADWNPDISLEPWDFDADFWENLATHPTIAGFGDGRA